MSISKLPLRRRVGLRRIAEELDISVSLVSKVLSGRLGTSGATESMTHAIRQKAVELNYRKNALAEALRTGRQNVLAVFVHRVGEAGSGIMEEMVAGIAQEAAGHGQRLLLQYFTTPAEFRQSALEVHRNAVDGVIIGGMDHPELTEDLKAMHREGLPVVTIHDRQVDPNFSNAGMDQVDVGCRATAHLIEQGCRRIVHLSARTIGDREGSSSPGMFVAAGRFEGYSRALSEADLPFRPELAQLLGDYTYQSGRGAMQSVLESGQPFDGVLGDSDSHAVAALNLLIERGIKVPEQVKLIGIDNSPFCRFTIVPLSSVSQEHTVRGQVAVQLLMKQLDGKTPSSIYLEPRICERQSSTLQSADSSTDAGTLEYGACEESA